MDNMETRTGLDGLIEEEKAMPISEDKVVKLRRPWVEWKVGENTYKLKLTAHSITQLERVFGKSLLSAVMDEGIPQVSVLVTLLQAAMQKYNHGIKSDTVGELLDSYIEDGGNQMSLLKDVVYPLMHEAGFFTEGQMRLLTREIAEADSTL